MHVKAHWLPFLGGVEFVHGVFFAMPARLACLRNEGLIAECGNALCVPLIRLVLKASRGFSPLGVFPNMDGPVIDGVFAQIIPAVHIWQNLFAAAAVSVRPWREG